MDPKLDRFVLWTARVLSALMAALILFIFIGEAIAEGLGPLYQLTLRERLMMLAFLASFLGLILGWLWEKPGGWLVVGGMAAFYLLDFFLSGSFPRGATFLLIALPGLLFLISGYSTPSERTSG